jgi:predicted RNA-binding protein with EMAP domain
MAGGFMSAIEDLIGWCHDLRTGFLRRQEMLESRQMITAERAESAGVLVDKTHESRDWYRDKIEQLDELLAKCPTPRHEA